MVGSSAGRFPFVTTCTKPGANVTIDPPSSAIRVVNVLKVIRRVLMGDTDDIVNVVTNLEYQAGPPPILRGRWKGSSATETRTVDTSFTVEGPAETSGSFLGVRVGLIQTVTEATIHDKADYSTTVGAPATGRLTYSTTTPLALWDANDASEPCFYDPSSLADFPSGSNPTWNGMKWIWDGPPVELVDTPMMRLADFVLAGLTFQWGLSMNGNRYLNGIANAIDLRFEVRLCATSQSVPGVVVPVDMYQDWRVQFSGYYTGSTWMDGRITASDPGSLTKPVTNPAKGPYNAKVIATPSTP